jgi:hypothetical protein
VSIRTARRGKYTEENIRKVKEVIAIAKGKDVPAAA